MCIFRLFCNNRPCYRKAVLLVGQFRVVIGYGDVLDDLCAFFREVDDAELSVFFQVQRILVSNRNLCGFL